ncbi:hypothetical protein [Aquamicrobium soli]|jgi:hypothetical protein|uniref:Uncharacterized protein n=1 Tax=Aquamicrobium soli TaxID=1811518 RepID=A0ABV7KK28_9HYPH
MKLAVAVTLEGLIRAMRWNAHDLAESVEGDGAARKRRLAGDRPQRRAPAPGEEQGDDRTRR